MAINISPTTGQPYYSGSWENIKAVCSVLNIDGGKLDDVTMEEINNFQEIVDREVDTILGSVYHTPLRAMNQKQPDGTTKKVFPGTVRRYAIYWTSGLLLLNQFQQLNQSMTDQAQTYIDDSRRQLFSMARFNNRLIGQEFRSNISRTLPPTLQPPDYTESNF